MSCGKTVSTHGNFGKNKNDNNKLKCIYCNSFRLLSKKKEHTNSLRQSYQTDSKSLFKFPKKNIIRSFLRFLPVFFPVFSRQIARYLPRKNRETYSKEILKTWPGQNLNRLLFPEYLSPIYLSFGGMFSNFCIPTCLFAFYRMKNTFEKSFLKNPYTEFEQLLIWQNSTILT